MNIDDELFGLVFEVIIDEVVISFLEIFVGYFGMVFFLVEL